MGPEYNKIKYAQQRGIHAIVKRHLRRLASSTVSLLQDKLNLPDERGLAQRMPISRRSTVVILKRVAEHTDVMGLVNDCEDMVKLMAAIPGGEEFKKSLIKVARELEGNIDALRHLRNDAMNVRFMLALGELMGEIRLDV